MRRDGAEKSRLPPRRQVRALAAWSGVIALFAIIACGAPASADAPGEIRSYKLAPGDRITVTVIGQEELSGDFPVDAAGNLLLPLVGSVEVRNLTIAECQKRIVERLADGILNTPSVFVGIAEARPIQVLGDVMTPGSYPYRPGTLVKSAIAQAGGFGGARQTRAAAVSEFLLADERVRVLRATRRRLLIRQARLEAQLDGAKTFTPPALPDILDDDQTTKLIVEERKALALQAEAYEKQVNAIQSLEPKLISESETIDHLIISQKKQVELVQNQVDGYNRLVEKGLGRVNEMVQLKLSLANKESNVWRLKSDRSRTIRTIGELKIRRQDVEASYKKQVLSELENVHQRLHDVEVTLPSACEVREVKLQETGRSIGAATARDIKITRLRDTDVTTFQATETTLLEPGDVVEVWTLRRSGGWSPMASAKKEFGESRKTGSCFSTIDLAGASAP